MQLRRSVSDRTGQGRIAPTLDARFGELHVQFLKHFIDSLLTVTHTHRAYVCTTVGCAPLRLRVTRNRNRERERVSVCVCVRLSVCQNEA